MNEDRSGLQVTVDAQDISPADVDRMNLERDQLSLSITSTTHSLSTLNSTVWEREILLQKKHDAMDKRVTAFNTLVYTLQGMDRSSGGGGLQTNTLEMTLNVHAGSQEGMIRPSVHGVLKGSLMKLRTRYVGSTHGCQDESLALMEGLDRLGEQAADKLEEVGVLEQLIRRANQAYTDEKDVRTMNFF